MTWSYSLTNNIGKVRLLIKDTSESNTIFNDEELTALLSMESDVVKRAAALALETMASNEAYVQKVIKLGDLSTNGPQTAAALLARAKELRTQADAEEAQADGGAFDVAEMVVDQFSWRNRIYNEALRNG